MKLLYFLFYTLIFTCSSPCTLSKSLGQGVIDIPGALSNELDDNVLDRLRELTEYATRQHSHGKDKHDVTKVDPDAKKNMSQLILGEGYPCEEHTVQTEDGYLLALYRIPGGRNTSTTQSSSRTTQNSTKKVVYLQHGLISSSCDWVMNFAHDSLGFILADAGYDVWMGNSRGNTYSLKHVKYTPKDVAFWDFSFDEMAKYDTTAFVDFILNRTSQESLVYVGHSQGTTMAYALMASQPQYQDKIKLFVNLAPVTHITFAKSPIVLLSAFSDEQLYEAFGRKDFLPSSRFERTVADLLCTDPATRWVCYNLLFLFVGPDLTNLNQTRLDVYMNHSPAGASTKDFIHFAQMYRQQVFAMYDYGSSEENMKHYNQTTPPLYDESKVKVPVVAFTAPRDWLADPKDAAALLATIPNLQYHEEIPEWNHIDFVWGVNANTACYNTILDWIHKYSV